MARSRCSSGRSPTCAPASPPPGPRGATPRRRREFNSSPPGACRGEVARMDRLARLDRAQARALAAACEEHAARLRAVVDPRGDAATANAAAARAWEGYLLSRGRILRPGQSARIRTVM